MSKYNANITKNADGSFYALVVREQNNGFGGVETIVVSSYKGRHFASLAAAQKSTAKFIAGC